VFDGTFLDMFHHNEVKLRLKPSSVWQMMFSQIAASLMDLTDQKRELQTKRATLSLLLVPA
jgi:hypothetical protein